MHIKTSPHQRGSSLIEVLVSLVLIAFGFLGLAGLFNYAASTNKNANSRLTAALLAQDYSELARANPVAVNLSQAYDRDLPGGTFDPGNIAVPAISASNTCAFPACTPQTLAVHDKEIFANRVKALLPGGEYVATQVKDAAGVFTNEIDIWLLWNEGKAVLEDQNATIDVCPVSISSAVGTSRPDPYPRCFFIRSSL